jgi:hypothetical protein
MTPGVPGSSPGSSGRTGRQRSRRPPEGPKRTKPAYRQYISTWYRLVHRYTGSLFHGFTGSLFYGFTGSRIEGYRVIGVRVFRLRFPSSFFVRFPHRVGRVRGRAGLPPEDRGAGWIVRMSGPGVRAWVGSDGSPGPPPARPGGKMKDKLPRVRFCKVRVGPRDPRPTGCRMGIGPYPQATNSYHAPRPLPTRRSRPALTRHRRM